MNKRFVMSLTASICIVVALAIAAVQLPALASVDSVASFAPVGESRYEAVAQATVRPTATAANNGQRITHLERRVATLEAYRAADIQRIIALENAVFGATPEPATPTPTASPIPPTPVPATPTPSPAPVTATPPSHDHEDMRWHPPGSHGDRPAHEHGDAPPQWVLDAGYDPQFDHPGNTPGENHPYWKHTAFKGWSGRFGSQDWYGVFHLDFNPGGHVSRFHSYQLWIRDASGAVSHMHGWLDFGEGNNTGPNLVLQCEGDDNVRPIISPPSLDCPVSFESWYARAGQAGWMPDFGFNINPNYYAGGDPTDPSTWISTGYVRNLLRRIEFAWYPARSTQRGEFYATQFGDIVSGPNAPACGSTRTIGTRVYDVVCLRQYIAPTLRGITFPGNSIQREFPGDGIVTLPN